MDDLNYIAPCHFGLESVLSFELKKLGASNVMAENGRVRFSGDHTIMARANINLRTAERVLIELAHFKAHSFEELFQGVLKAPIEEFVGAKDAFPIKGWSLNSKLFSVSDCQSIIKKAMVERMKKHYKIDWFMETGALHQMQFSIHNDEVSLMLDTSGEGLHKRSYRQKANIAPIKETLAAGIIDLARVRDNSIVYDPFCGSGTILIEAATKALNIPPCLKRKFAAQEYSVFSPKIWADERSRGVELIRRDTEFIGYGADIELEAISLTLENARRAGVDNKIRLEQMPISEFVPKTDNGIIITNPPYGERMLEIKEAEAIYREMGGRFIALDGFSTYIISPHEKFEELYGVKAKKRRKLYNGMIKCQLYSWF